MSKTILFLMLVTSFEVSANFTKCGDYQAIGEILRTENDMLLVVNAKSASEYKLKLEEEKWPLVVPFINLQVKAEIKILKDVIGYQGSIHSITKIDRHIPNYLTEKNIDQLKLIKEEECNK